LAVVGDTARMPSGDHMSKKRSGGKETKTSFLRTLLTKNPDIDHHQVNRIWTKRGHAGQISNALFYQVRVRLGIRTEWVWVREGEPASATPETRHEETITDPLVEAAQNNLKHILALYKLFEHDRPVMLFDLQSQQIYAYPYKEYKATLNERSQAILERQYQQAITENKIVVFVRDNESQRLTSMVLDKD
jgi:hypothetical protein